MYLRLFNSMEIFCVLLYAASIVSFKSFSNVSLNTRREVWTYYLGDAKLNPFLKRGIKNRSTEFIHDCYRMGARQHCVSVHTAALALVRRNAAIHRTQMQSYKMHNYYYLFHIIIIDKLLIEIKSSLWTSSCSSFHNECSLNERYVVNNNPQCMHSNKLVSEVIIGLFASL